MSQSFSFTATSSSETLYFLANGTPSGQPPFTLLGDVTLVPEAKDYAYWTLLFGILIMVGNRFWRRNQKRSPEITSLGRG